MKLETGKVSALILTVFAIVIAVLSYNVVWLGDDTLYAYSFADGKAIENMGDIVRSQVAHFTAMNGRVVTHTLVQLYCGILGHLAFAVANALMFIFFVLTAAYLSNVKFANWKGILTISLLVVLIFQTRMAPACQINYMWSFPFSMLVMILFFRKASYKAWLLPLLFILAVWAGNGNESLSIGMSGAFIIYWFYKRAKLTVAQYCMMIGYGLGTLIIVLSPHAWERADKLHVDLLSNILGFLLHNYALWILVAVVLYRKLHDKHTWRQIIVSDADAASTPPLFLWALLAVCVAFNFVIGIGGARQLFGEQLMCILLAVRLTKRHTFTNFWLVAFAAFAVFQLVNQTRYVFKVKGQVDEIVDKYKRSADGNVYFKPDLEKPWFFSDAYTLPVPFLSEDLHPENNIKTFRQFMHLQTKEQSKPEVTILPEQLAQPEFTDGKNHIVHLSGGLWLFVQSKAEPAALYVDREVDIPFYHRKYEPMEVQLNNVLIETPQWRAQYVSEVEYTIRRLSKNRFFLLPSSEAK